MMPTTGFLATRTLAHPHAARTPASCGVSLLPERKTISPFLKSSSRSRTFSPWETGFFIRIVSPASSVYSTMTAASAPSGSTPPVGMYVHSVLPIERFVSCFPITTRPTHRRRAGTESLAPVVSADRTAYPSTTDRSNPGISVSATTAEASTRHADRSTGTVSVLLAGAIFSAATTASATEITFRNLLI